MLAGVSAVDDCIKVLFKSEFTEVPKEIEVLTLILHGDDDHIVPFGASGKLGTVVIRVRGAEGVVRRAYLDLETRVPNLGSISAAAAIRRG
jgi:hypothetical protein